MTARRLLLTGFAAVVVGGLALAALVLRAPGREDADPGATVVVARPADPDDWFVARLHAELAAELGYRVADPADHQLDTADAYPALVERSIDVWTGGRFPTDDPLLEATGGAARVVGTRAPSGHLRGLIIDADSVEARELTTLGQLADPEVAARFDTDGDGRAEIVGCPTADPCAAEIDDRLEILELEGTVERVPSTWDEAVARFEAGTPLLAYAELPGRHLAELAIGVEVFWLSVPSPPGEVTVAPGAVGCAEQPCELGWLPDDARTVVSDRFAADRPDLVRLFELVRVDPLDVAAQNALAHAGADGELDLRAQATEWILDHRTEVDQWLAQARAAR